MKRFLLHYIDFFVVQWTRNSIVFTFFMLFLTSRAVAQVASCDVEWRPPIQISYDSVLSNKPQLAISGSTVHLIWYGFDTLGTVGRDGIQYARSTDSGATFSPQQTLLSLDSALSPALIACAGSFTYVTALALSDTFYGTAILRSSDGGSTWQPLQTLLRAARPEAITALDSTVYIHFRFLDPRIQYGGLLASTDAGLTWDVSTVSMPHVTSIVVTQDQMHGIGSVNSDFETEVAYFGSYTPGKAWFEQEILSGEDTIASVRPKLTANDGGDLFAVWSEKGRILLRLSRNQGLTWRPAQLLSPDTSGVFSDVAAGSEFVSVVWDNDFGGTGGIRIRTSNDYGSSFCPTESPTPGTEVGEPAIALNGKRVHVAWTESIGGNVEILYRNGTLTDNPDLITTPPTTFALLQNYPNPFNGSTHIRYDVPVATHVQLVVYNILGELVATLVDEMQSQRKYDITFDSGNYPSGVYFFRLRADSFSEVRKFLIMR